MITIMKASAGSGKTYTLAHRYIDILMNAPDEYEYRHILAVTFTHKATAEMKGRILQELYALSRDGNPENAAVAAKAGRILSHILHDYSAFAISTIDSFFQQTLRAFARELGRFASYQVELESRDLIEETVDFILDSLDPDKPECRQLMEFILESMEEKAAEGKKPDIESDLKDIATQIESENFSVKAAALGLKVEQDYTPDKLKTLKRLCRDIITAFEQEAVSRSGEILRSVSAAGIAPTDFNGGSNSWFLWFEKFASHEPGKRFEPLTPAFVRKVSETEGWFAKTKAGLLPKAVEAVGAKTGDFVNWWNSRFKAYNTAYVIMSRLYGLGIAASLSSAFHKLQNEKNVVCLSESNAILKDIIDGSDAPFVYEKIGVYFKHFLLDEFQDTSVTQWDNFLPLLKESNASGGNNLIVGDVKQSIYRWRESDWSLLDSGVEKEFPESKPIPLQKNWRSAEEIVKFNNAFYRDVALKLDQAVPEEGGRRISDIYSDVCQTVGKKEHLSDGGVQTVFCEDAVAELDAIAQAIRTAHENGVRYGDIAVLVRKNTNGTDVANRLIAENIPLVTESSLCIKNSISVRRMVSLMSYVGNPDDRLNAKIAEGLAVSYLPDSFHSLAGLCEELYLILAQNDNYRDDLHNDVVYINAFMDYLMDYTASNGNNLKDFLQTWAGDDPSISSPLGTDSVQILTIHKSKGLDFPFVIVPFLEGITLYEKTRTRDWCTPRAVDGLPAGMENKLFLVPLNSKSEDTAFDEAYRAEKYNQCVDAINLMYVATTRASKGMLLIGKPKQGAYANFADILYDWCEGRDLTLGKGFGFSYPAEKETAPAGGYTLDYDVIPTGARLGVRPYAEEFFTSDSDGFDSMSFRRRGIVLHDILGRVIYKEDLPGSVDAAVADGSIKSADREYILSLLTAAVGKHPEYFPPAESGVRVLTECPIIGRDGRESRPDRVLIYPDGSVEIIDYKFGAYYDEYERQLERYRSLFMEMGCKSVKAGLWFVNKNV